ncbi:hypothetical protein C7B61_16465 [filamentous cyanobacterium CCP1]|nr:hypothetical protein C7B76_21800 [filamentous cyanobacterium CCP2]PSB61080.1 hypothetical protein C7B61_16465 [filamentous cyanobacterium CCP1]
MQGGFFCLSVRDADVPVAISGVTKSIGGVKLRQAGIKAPKHRVVTRKCIAHANKVDANTLLIIRDLADDWTPKQYLI